MKKLVEEIKSYLTESKSLSMGFTAEEAEYQRGYEAALGQVIEKLEAALKPRPIEIAPTDGTSILLFGRHWNEPANRWDTGWIEGKWFDDEAHKTQNWFTHWLPLPPKPPMPMDGGEE